MFNDLWNFSDTELEVLKSNVGKLYQLSQELVWNACDILDRPNDMAVMRIQLEELSDFLHQLSTKKMSHECAGSTQASEA